MSTSLLVAAGFALAGALFAAIFLPAREQHADDAVEMRDTGDQIELIAVETNSH